MSDDVNYHGGLRHVHVRKHGPLWVAEWSDVEWFPVKARNSDRLAAVASLLDWTLGVGYDVYSEVTIHTSVAVQDRGMVGGKSPGEPGIHPTPVCSGSC